MPVVYKMVDAGLAAGDQAMLNTSMPLSADDRGSRNRTSIQTVSSVLVDITSCRLLLKCK